MNARTLLTVASVATLLLGTSCGSNHADITSFYKAHRQGEHVTNVTLPKWMVRMGGRIAARHIDGPEARLIKPFVNKIGKIRILVAEEGAAWSNQEHKSFKAQLLASGFDDYIYIRDGETQVQLMLHEVDAVFKDVLIFFADEGESGMIALQANISIEDIAKILEQWVQEQKQEKLLRIIDIPKKRIPQV